MKEGWTRSWAPTTQEGKTISRGESSGKDREEAVAVLLQGRKQLEKEHHPCGAELAAIPLDSVRQAQCLMSHPPALLWKGSNGQTLR